MNETLMTIKSLHSTHGNFSERAVSEESLQIIIRAAVRASTASNRQSYSIIVVEDKTVMKKYFQYVGSVALLFCVDYNRLKDIGAHLGHETEYGGIVDFITGTTDTILAAQTAAIAASSIGIDYLFTNSVHRGDMKQLYKQFGLSETVQFPVIAMILGYNDGEKKEPRGRLEDLGIVHWNSYRRYGEEELNEIMDRYDKGNHMGLVFYNEESKKKYPRYFDWFFKVWSRPDSEKKAKKNQEMMELLRKIGFL